MSIAAAFLLLWGLPWILGGLVVTAFSVKTALGVRPKLSWRPWRSRGGRWHAGILFGSLLTVLLWPFHVGLLLWDEMR